MALQGHLNAGALQQPTPLFFSQLPAITGGSLLQQSMDVPLGPLVLDSRTLRVAPGSVFFALRGKNHDSHQHLKDVYAQGIRQFVVEHPSLCPPLPQANLLYVPNSIEALQKLAAYHRQQFQLPLLAITGSNAKTIVKEWIGQLLAQQYTVVKSPKSYNSQTGVPLSVWQLNDTHQYGVFEAGISLPGEMARLAAVLKPTHGLFTNIGSAHDQGFTSREQKIDEKAQLFQSCQRIYYCLDHQPIHQALTKRYQGKTQLVHWSFQDEQATYQVSQQPGTHSNTTLLTIATADHTHTFTLPFCDSVSIENTVHCIVLLLHEGFAAALLQAGLSKLQNVPMRLTLKQGVNECQIIDDTYNNDVVGLQTALDFMAQQKPGAQRAVILTDFLQTGAADEVLYPQIAQMLRENKVIHLLGVGRAITQHAAAFTDLKAQFYRDTTALLQDGVQHHFHNELILVKGARQFGLEKVVAQLQQKIHRTVLEVDLDAMRHNLNFFRSRLASHTKLMIVVKALAYGSSSFEVPQLLQHHKVDYLAVAYADEGVSLRTHGITLPIMVMNPTPESFAHLMAYGLEPEIYSLELLQTLAHFVANQKVKVKIHLKLETGMHRLGIAESELSAVIKLLQAHTTIELVGIMSHLAAASAAQHDAYTHAQAALFRRMANYIEQSLGIQTTKHLLNTAGILRFPEYQADMVRLGIGLHGVGVSPAVASHLAVSSTLKTVISQVKAIPQAATVGYDRQGVAQKDMRTATIAIGYADGFGRGLSHGQGSVLVHGQLAPVVGNVCMDMAMIDVTHVPEATVGDEVIVFGQERPIAEVASALDTISNEVLTNVSERVKRVYYTG
ncbi:MAG: bifunctional UDP-N-acetylmuramoyl-tripeptide:D-alanyl-D-alanine ligase/alanine racemase [Bacteroidota bacterium]